MMMKSITHIIVSLMIVIMGISTTAFGNTLDCGTTGNSIDSNTTCTTARPANRSVTRLTPEKLQEVLEQEQQYIRDLQEKKSGTRTLYELPRNLEVNESQTFVDEYGNVIEITCVSETE